MKVLRIGIASIVLVSISSCSTLASNGRRIDYGAEAKQVPSLEVPPDLTTPVVDDRYKVPKAGTETVATYSDFNKGGSQSHAAVLPVVPGVHMERNIAERWLVVNEKPENVWPVVKAFWEDLGLTISSENPAAGVMETQWAENRAKNSQSGSHNGENVDFNNAYHASERDQYITRLERSKDGANTEVYITHHGIKEEYSPTKHASQWVARPDDPELEAIMLQRLMVRFGAGETQAAQQVAAASTVATASSVAASAVPAVGPALPNELEPAGRASLHEVSPGNIIVVVNDPFDRSWRKVGLALESAGLVLEDKDRDKGIYYLRPVKLESSWLDKLKFWKSNKDITSHYRVIVKDGGSSCEVTVIDQGGASNKISKQMLEAIYKNINQQQ
jgi:outer membrane protein assembly factor BamC